MKEEPETSVPKSVTTTEIVAAEPVQPGQEAPAPGQKVPEATKNEDIGDTADEGSNATNADNESNDDSSISSNSSSNSSSSDESSVYSSPDLF